MQKKKEFFLDKVIKKNFNNELEHVLENKSFDENTKSILLSILYKVETAYSDYEQVKKDVISKDDFIKRIINAIDNNIDDIILVKMDSDEAKILENKTFIINKKNKQIICYPIERKLLYAILKISNKEKIIKDKYYIINKTFSDLLNTGYNINNVEPMRDFNGFSWEIVSKDIESIEYNLIYQSLRILCGSEFLNRWINNNEFIIDYYEVFKNNLEEIYGKKIQEELIDSICKLSVLLEAKYNKEQLKYFLNNKKNIHEKLLEIKDKEKFIKNLTNNKKKINTKIKQIDTIINDKELLQEEYIKRNDKLPLEKKIFSMRVLSKMMQEERQELVNERQNINEMLNPQKFMKYQKELEDKNKYLKYLDESNIDKLIEKELYVFLVKIIECLKIKIEKSNQKDEILNLLIELRYFINLPFNQKNKIYQIDKLKEKIDDIIKISIVKSINEKVLINLSQDINVNVLILKEIFKTKIIDFKNINIEITKEEQKLFLQMFDENTFEEKICLGQLELFDLKKFLIRFNKTIKIFNI